MNKKMKDILAKIKELQAKARVYQEDGKLEDAKNALSEIKNLQTAYENEKVLFELEKEDIPEDPTPQNKVDGYRVMCKVAQKKPLTEAEAAMVTGGSNGEDYLIPEDVRLEITQLRRQYRSAQELVNTIPTNSLTGSFNFEKGTPASLTNFTDGSTIGDSDEPKIEQKPFTCAQWGAIIGVSNRLIGNEKAQLMSYIDQWFVKKAILTENAKIFAELKNEKTPVTYADLDDFLQGMILDIDPGFENDMMITTNQHGYAWMAMQKDNDGRNLLVPDVANPAVKRFNGAVVNVFPTRQLENVEGKAPFFIGNTKAGCYFITREQMSMASSDDALFGKNQKALRIIEDFDVIGADKEAYIYALVDVSALIPAAE